MAIDPNISEPRRVEIATVAVREAQAQKTGGKPMLDFEGESTPYIDYESIDVLLSLQHPRSPVHDEMAFYIAGQVMELLFKLAVTETRAATAHLEDDNIPAACKLLRRITKIEELLTTIWPMLETITPADFKGFRDYLGTSSGFQSYMYRALEFSLGNKNRAMLQPHRGVPSVYPELLRAFESPSIWDVTAKLLARRGYAIDPDHLERDVTAPYQPNASVEAVWLQIYEANDPANELFELGERLMDVAAAFTTWRMKHLVIVERIIGFKVGTGGTAGVSWLRSIIDHRFFPELWTLRTVV
ncbi:tryptophan 2,3-dioxygenase [Catenulispora rubra]|uniref:tryptophan 2,3-dioxygenase n=1 Tax=Catenulispora rubra TaxID=280293 RepID=UPI001E364FB5|nr:tryptophan 2,3-dioxygenase family protein [Catenulispora rubra]